MSKRLAVALMLSTAACAPQAVPPKLGIAVAESKPHRVVVTEAIDPTAADWRALELAAAVEARRVRVRPTRSYVRPRPAAPRIALRGEGDLLACIRRIESGGRYDAVSASGRFRGAYQFDRQTFASVGGDGDPATASPAEQDAAALALIARRGLQPWPTPSRVCG